MSGDRLHGRGFRLTWRHVLILAVYLVILLDGVLPFLQGTVLKGTRSIVLISMLVSPPLLAFLVVVIDRAGPVKNWAVSFLICLLFPAIALNHDGVLLVDYLAGEKLPAVWATLLLNITLIPASIMYFGKMVPKSCPGCGKRTLIPLMRVFMKDKRTTNTRWCASCGGKYWKDREGNWQVERRRTWLDVPERASASAASHPSSASGSEVALAGAVPPPSCDGSTSEPSRHGYQHRLHTHDGVSPHSPATRQGNPETETKPT